MSDAIMLQVIYLPGTVRILWRFEDGEEMWYEYQMDEPWAP